MPKAILHKAKVIKAGNSYAIRIPKALVDSEVLKEEAEYDIEIKDLVTAVFLTPVELIEENNTHFKTFSDVALAEN